MKNKKGNIAVFVLIGVIIAITAGVIGFMFAKKTQVPAQQTVINQPPAPIVQTQPATQPTQQTDETASWQTYSNAKYGYEIKYPVNYKYKDVTQDMFDAAKRSMGGGPLAESYVVFGVNSSDLKVPVFGPREYSFLVSVFKGSIAEEILGLPISDESAKFSKKLIAGNSWTSKEVTSNDPNASYEKGSIEYSLEKGGKTFIISTTPKFVQNKDFSEKILSTFKFTI